MLQFSLRSLFVVTAWVAVVVVGMRVLAHELPRLHFVNVAIVLAGAVTGTLFGEAFKGDRKTPSSRVFVSWSTAFVFGATHIAWFIGPGYLLLYLSIIQALIFAFLAAVLTELLRFLLVAVEREGGK